MSGKETLFFKIKTVTPIHIGCGEDYEPTMFTVDEKKLEMTIFSPFDMLATLTENERDEFTRVCSQGTVESLHDIYRFLGGKSFSGRKIAVSKGFSEHYKDILGRDRRFFSQNFSSMQIRRTAYHQTTGLPYLPGSSIKGAIRTAFLNHEVKGSDSETIKRIKQELREGQPRFKAKKLEGILLKTERHPEDAMAGNSSPIERDPFRLVKVSDFLPLPGARTRVCHAIHRSRKPQSEKGWRMPVMVEVIEPGSEFCGSITFDVKAEGSAVSMGLGKTKISKGIKSFFSSRAAEEKMILSALGMDTANHEKIEKRTSLRVGFHSGAESMTVEGFREICINPKNQSIVSDHATTIWVASESKKDGTKGKPFGWCFFDLLKIRDDVSDTFNSCGAFIRECADEASCQALSRVTELRAAAEKAEAAATAMKQEEARKERERLERETQERELETMSEGMRAARIIAMPKTIGNTIFDLYNRIDSFQEEERREIAAALKARWQSEGKWEGKKLTDKQLKKVAKTRLILGE